MEPFNHLAVINTFKIQQFQMKSLNIKKKYIKRKRKNPLHIKSISLQNLQRDRNKLWISWERLASGERWEMVARIKGCALSS